MVLRGQDRMTRLQNCLALGYQLRHVVQPALAAHGIHLQTILFVTDQSLSAHSIEACSFFWALNRTSTSEAHPKKLRGTPRHLVAGGIGPSHVYLKTEDATYVCMSDVDMITSWLQALTNNIRGF